MNHKKGHNYNPKGEIAQKVMKTFRNASSEMWHQFKRASIGAHEHIIHGMELEGFVLKPDGSLATQSAISILEQIDDERFDVESGGHQIEFRSDPVILSAANFENILGDIIEQRGIVNQACLRAGFNFATRSIPLDLPYNLESELDLFTTDPFFVEHRAYDQEIMGRMEKPFQVKYRNGRPAFFMQDYTLGLSLISGVHNNISFSKPETAFAAYNMALQMSPLICALGANGGSLGGKRLLKKDYRLHIGLMSECVRVKLDHDPYLDAGLPVPLRNGWEEYIQRLTDIGFMLPDEELIQSENDFLKLYDNLREQSWAFVKVKMFPNDRLGIEIRPLSAQCNSEANAAYHMFIVWTLTNLLEENEFRYNSWETLGRDIQAGLKAGPEAMINFNGKHKTAAAHFDQISDFLKPKIVQKGLATEELFDHVVNTIRKAMAFNAMELTDYSAYRSQIVNDFTF